MHQSQLWGPNSSQLLNGYQRIFLVQKLRLSEDVTPPHAFMTCTEHPDLYLYEKLGSLYKSSLRTEMLCLIASVTFLFSGNINIKLKRHFLVA
jgi:hypothetical protein